MGPNQRVDTTPRSGLGNLSSLRKSFPHRSHFSLRTSVCEKQALMK